MPTADGEELVRGERSDDGERTELVRGGLSEQLAYAVSAARELRELGATFVKVGHRGDLAVAFHQTPAIPAESALGFESEEDAPSDADLYRSAD